MLKKYAGILISPAIILIFAASSSVSAWDDVGHKVSAYIAWQQMTPAVRDRVVKILLSAPEDSDLSVFYPPDSRSDAEKQRELFMVAAYWSDIVRDRKFKNRFEKYHHSNWHYSDTFWRQENGQAKIIEKPNEEGGKAVEKLFDFEKVLKDAGASDADKAIAVAWVLHLGGDVHQPLHTSARVSDLEPNGDQGGNLFLLTPEGTPRENQDNLHWFWDSIIKRNVTRKGDACDSDYLPPIAARMMKKHPLAKMQNRLMLGQFDKWQQESFQIATSEFFPPTLVRFQTPPEKYKKRAFEISQQQIALAGYRLGSMFNQIFGNQSITQSDKDRYLKEAKQTGSEIGLGENDSWLWFKTRAALATTTDLRDTTIAVDVVNSIITLRGTVPNKQQKAKAEQIAKNIEGVKQLINKIKIAPK